MNRRGQYPIEWAIVVAAMAIAALLMRSYIREAFQKAESAIQVH